MENFLEQLRNNHQDFEKGKIDEIIETNPFVLFQEWFDNAVSKRCLEVNACSIATVDSKGQPSSRIVYLKELLNQEFVFYTNYLSQKGRDIEQNNKVSLLFFWAELQQQIRIEGVCSKVDESISDEYFQSRPRESKVGAWASEQSKELLNRTDLEQKFELFSKKFEDEIPRPKHWGGYKITANKFEFWQGRPSRLHDRFVFEKEKNNWVIKRLNP